MQCTFLLLDISPVFTSRNLTRL